MWTGIVVQWIVRPVVGVFVGRVAYELAKLGLGFDPAEWGARMIWVAPSPTAVEFGRWLFAGIIAFGALAYLERNRSRRLGLPVKPIRVTVSEGLAVRSQQAGIWLRDRWTIVGPYLPIIGLMVIVIGVAITAFGFYHNNGLPKAADGNGIVVGGPIATVPNTPPAVSNAPAPGSLAEVPATAPPNAMPFYAESEIQEMLLALRELREIADKKVAPADWAASEIRNSWGRLLTTEGPAKVADRLKQIRDPIRASQNQINQWLYEHQHYDAQLRPVAGNFGALDVVVSAASMLIDDLEEYSKAQNVDVSKLVRGRYEEWAGKAMPALEQWIGQVGARITAKTKEIREWKSIAPAISAVPQKKESALTSILYTEREIRELLDALTEAHKLLEEIIAPAFYRVEVLASNIPEAIPNQGVEGFVRALTNAREEVQTQVWPKVNDFVYKTHSRYKDEMRYALALDEEAAKGEMIRKLDVAIEAVKLLPANSTRETNRLIEPQFKEVRDQIQPPVYKWIGTARTRIAKMTSDLRTKGTIEYEKK